MNEPTKLKYHKAPTYQRALVLSGGEAKGDGQAGAVYRLRERGWDWEHYIGTSVGAMNGWMMATRQLGRLRELWHNIKNKDVYNGKLNAWHAAWRLLRGKNSILNTNPLKRLIDQNVDIRDMDSDRYNYECSVVDLDFGCVSYWGLGCLVENHLNDEAMLKKMIMASGTMPIIMPPVHHNTMQLVDGGLRDNTPLKRAIDAGADLVTVVIASPPLQIFEHDSILHIASRTLQILMDELIEEDIKQCIRINNLVLQAKEQGNQLFRRDGKPYKYVHLDIIRANAKHNWGSKLMDFESREWANGVKAANEYLDARLHGTNQTAPLRIMK